VLPPALVGREGKLTSDVVRTPVALRSQKNHKQIQEILILVHAEGLNKMGSTADVLNILMNKNGLLWIIKPPLLLVGLLKGTEKLF
jgi:hypothetical protein